MEEMRVGKSVKDLKAFKTLKGFHQVVLCLRSAKVEVSEAFRV